MGRIEGFRKQSLHLDCFRLAFEIRQNHGNVAAKFPNQLAARATGRSKSIGIRYHGNGVEAALTFADGFEDGDPLGANGKAVRGVLDVATSKNSSGGGAERGTHAKIRIWRVRVFPRLPRGQNQNFIFAHAYASWGASKYPMQSPPQFAE